MSILNTLILVGAIQGLISSAILFFAGRGFKIADRLLAGLLLLLSLACLNLFLMNAGFQYYSEATNKIALVIPLLIVMPMGPLIYFYVQTRLTKHFRITASHRRHFYTLILDLLPYLAGAGLVIGLLLQQINALEETLWRRVMDEYNTYVDIFRWGSMTLYVYWAARLLKNLNEVEAQTRRWLRQFMLVFAAFQLLWFLHLVPYLLPSFRNEFIAWVTWYPLYVPLAIIVYWLGINGLIRRLPAGIHKEGAAIAADVVEQTHRTLTRSMESDRLFLDPELNLDRIVRHTGIPQKTISTVLNQHLGLSFNGFVNAYRVEELKKRLTQSGNDHLTIMGLGLDCGFNSQATLQRAFKQHGGQSPREFLLTQKAKGESDIIPNSSQI
jgi:AraC-like DNA-binding protein